MTIIEAINNVWITKDNRKIAIKDMSNSHLLNAIALLQRNAERKRVSTSLFYTLCVEPSGDAAMDCFMQEQNNAWNSEWADYVPEIYWNMLEESSRRGLELKDNVDLSNAELSILKKFVEEI